LSSTSTSRFSPSCSRTGLVSASRGSTAGCVSPLLPPGAVSCLLRRRRRLPRESTEEPSEAESSS
jgi:hypothetical protein